MPSIRVLLADDHVMVRQGLCDVLQREADMEVVAEASDGQQAVELAAEFQPDVVVLDAAMPGLSGVEATRQIKARCPDTIVLLLSAHDSDAYVFASLEAGATGYLLKTSGMADLIQAIRTASTGISTLHPDIARKLLDRSIESPPSADEEPPSGQAPGNLSDREMEVLKLAARGWTNQDIARELQVSVRTVQAHLSHTFAKTGTRSRTEAVVMALARGWLSLKDALADAPCHDEDRVDG